MVKHLSERGEYYVQYGDLAVRKQSVLYSPSYPWEEVSS